MFTFIKINYKYTLANMARASLAKKCAYYVSFRCYIFKAHVPKILSLAQPICFQYHATCLTITCSCCSVLYGHLPCHVPSCPLGIFTSKDKEWLKVSSITKFRMYYLSVWPPKISLLFQIIFCILP